MTTLAKSTANGTLVYLDEPTAGLRFVLRDKPFDPINKTKVLQQAWRTANGIEWRNVPLVVEDGE